MAADVLGGVDKHYINIVLTLQAAGHDKEGRILYPFCSTRNFCCVRVARSLNFLCTVLWNNLSCCCVSFDYYFYLFN